MKNYSAFDILGPVMVGPSSSHTAGAARLGRAARCIAQNNFNSVTFYLHGSFAKTYRGHGTDRALVAGILGMETHDERIKDSLKIAEENGIDVKFIESDLGDVHPNTVKIVLNRNDGTSITVTGSSVGGGSISIISIDDDPVDINGEYPVVIIKHSDKRGMVSKITFAVALGDVNIATLKVGRETKGEVATTVIETDNIVPEDTIREIAKIDGVISVRAIEAL
jgi:L-serine dehydratase